MSARSVGRMASKAGEIVRAGSDLVVPTTCGGCAEPGVGWCDACASCLADDPVRHRPRVGVGVGVWALGPYRGPRRAALIAVKEHGRRDLNAPLGRALAGIIATLARWGELPPADTLTLIPAPTRRSSARRRGGDPVTAMARVAANRLGPRVSVAPVLVTAGWARDSAGLDARRRVRNLTGAIAVRGGAGRLRRDVSGTVVLVDDIVTTGATAAESVRVLARHGVGVGAVIVVAAA